MPVVVVGVRVIVLVFAVGVGETVPVVVKGVRVIVPVVVVGVGALV